MKILINQFLGANHSWAKVGQCVANEFIKQNHQVDLFATDGIKHLPNNLKKHIIGYRENNDTIGNLPGNIYDLSFAYTAPINFANYLRPGKIKLGIWCYEFSGKNILPSGFAKQAMYCDYLLPPSNFAKQGFLDSGVPEKKMRMIPHGVDQDVFKPDGKKYQLKTKAAIRMLSNIAQPHIRKNLFGLLESYGKAFKKTDDICLVLKIVDKEPTQTFEISFKQIFRQFKDRFPNHAEVEIITSYIDDIADLYRATNVSITSSHGEAFWMPGLEAMASEHLIISPRWGGQLDFLSDNNALLIDGKEGFCPSKAMYWGQRNDAKYFFPNINNTVNTLRYMYQNFESLKQKHNEYNKKLLPNYTWEKVTNQILELTK